MFSVEAEAVHDVYTGVSGRRGLIRFCHFQHRAAQCRGGTHCDLDGLVLTHGDVLFRQKLPRFAVICLEYE